MNDQEYFMKKLIEASKIPSKYLKSNKDGKILSIQQEFMKKRFDHQIEMQKKQQKAMMQIMEIQHEEALAHQEQLKIQRKIDKRNDKINKILDNG